MDKGLVEERNILNFFGSDEKLRQEAVRREQIELAELSTRIASLDW